MAPAASPRAARWKARAISISLMNGNLAGNSRFFRTNGTLTTITCRTRRFHTTISAKRHRRLSHRATRSRLFRSARLFFRGPIEPRHSGAAADRDPSGTTTRPSTSTGQILRHWRQAELDFNLTSLSASSASFQAVGPRVLDNAYGLYDICTNYVPGQAVAIAFCAGLAATTRARRWKRPGSANTSIRSVKFSRRLRSPALTANGSTSIRQIPIRLVGLWHFDVLQRFAAEFSWHQ